MTVGKSSTVYRAWNKVITTQKSNNSFQPLNNLWGAEREVYFRHSPLEAILAVSYFPPARLALKPNPISYKTS